MPYLGIFGLQFEKKRLSYLKSAPSNFSNCKFGEKTKISKFLTKNVWLRYFWVGIWKKYCHFWNEYTRICLIAKYHEIIKMPKFGTKSTLSGYFWARILKTLLSYLKSAPSNLSICKISQKKQKCWNLGPKMAYLGIFDQKCLVWVLLGKNFKDTIVILEISTPKFA